MTEKPLFPDPAPESGIDLLPGMGTPAPDKNPNPLAVVEDAKPPAVPQPLAIIAAAVQSGNLDVAVLEKLSALQERWEDRQAEQAFHRAMADFQAECPIIAKNKRAEIKSKKGSGSSYGYNYAGYAFIMQEIQPLLNVHGLSLSFSSTQEGGPARIACKVSHRDGYSQTTTFDCPMPANMLVNDTQKMGAALTYGRRYALVSALNIVVAGEDDGAACVRPEPVENPKQKEGMPDVGTRGERERIKTVGSRWFALHPIDDTQAEIDKAFAGWIEGNVLNGPTPDGWRWDADSLAKAAKQLDKEEGR